MILIDVNVLVYAHREDSENHARFRNWLEGVVNGNAAYGVSELTLSGFLRVVTSPRVFNPPSSLEAALEFAEQIRSQPQAVFIQPGNRHWEIFTGLCRKARAKGNLVPDAYFAALAIESGCEWITTDRDFTRFPGLKISHPFPGA